ncbi:hypothetical protein [Calothrix sp. UHCC 0171]|uniref:hypothetical protein n=1 Tax=Calothrix sp. UHCC 0171 TaxID=3110245 RepID=UPI002B1FE1C0|nr:hypothetical protein [Calothrix sp. UHCC 0171]MEA5573460.1 hypothetical protein [Calothrix sp. UHCC 0171]
MKKIKEIEKLLRQALLDNGKMEYALFEFELEEHIDYWYKGLKRDKEELVFAVTENRGYVAMVLITKKKDIYVNQEARTFLMEQWEGEVYRKNMEILIPMMSKELANDILAVNGVKIDASYLGSMLAKSEKNTKQMSRLEKILKNYQEKHQGILSDRKTE